MEGEVDLDPWAYLARMGVRGRAPNDQFFLDGDAVCAMRTVTYLTQEDEEEFLHPDVTPFFCPAPECPLDTPFRQLHAFETHYASAHTHACGACPGLTLPSEHLLGLHVAEAHDAYFAVLSERKAAFQCFLERCPEKFWHPDQRKEHCLAVHEFLGQFKYLEGWGSPKGKPKSSKPPPPPPPSSSSEAGLAMDCSENAVSVKSNSAKPPSSIPQPVAPAGSPVLFRPNPSKLRRPMSLSPVKRSSRPARPLSVVDSPTSSRGRDPATTPTESDRSRFGFRRNSLEPNHIPDLNGGIQRRFSLTPSAMKKPFNRHSVALDHPNLSAEIIMDNSPTRTTPLSLARMGERGGSSSRKSSGLSGNSVDVSSAGSSAVNSPYSSHPNSNLSSQSGLGSSSTSPNKRSRIPVFNRSPSVKLPANISFGANVERGFESPWYRDASATKQSNRNSLQLERNDFVAEMRGALDY